MDPHPVRGEVSPPPTTTSTRPDWLTLPNAVTLLRLLLLAPVCWLLVRTPGDSPLVVGLLALWAATDWVDGFLARALHQVSRTGEMLDPITDRVGIGAVLLALALGGHVSWWPVGIVVVTDLATGLLAGRAAARGRIKVHLLGKFRTAVLFVGIVALIAALAFYPPATIFGRLLLWAGAALHVVAGATYIRAAVLGARRPPAIDERERQ